MATPNTPHDQQPPQANPGIPYILYYRSGSNPYPQFFIFYHPSRDMRVVVERVKKHCELMNYRFTNVRPFVVDLAEAEARLLGVSQETCA